MSEIKVQAIDEGRPLGEDLVSVLPENYNSESPLQQKRRQKTPNQMKLRKITDETLEEFGLKKS